MCFFPCKVVLNRVHQKKEMNFFITVDLLLVFDSSNIKKKQNSAQICLIVRIFSLLNDYNLHFSCSQNLL